jgi:hypothetical protein
VKRERMTQARRDVEQADGVASAAEQHHDAATLGKHPTRAHALEQVHA